MEHKKILIVSGGSIADDFVLHLIKENSYGMVIACDSGMEFFRRSRCYPDLIVGDFDSASAQAVEYFRTQTKVQIEQFPSEKDWTDTELAVRRALDLKPQHIDLVGATGSRLDHVMGNLQLLAMGLSRKTEIFLLDVHNRIRLIGGALALKKEEQYGNYVSLVPYAGAVHGLTLTGMKYPLHGVTLEPGVTLGISNEIVGDVAQISFESGMLFVIEARD